jgi:hypothetical protein
MSSQETGDWVPAFKGQRPPFQVGNVLTLKHGAWSNAKVSPLADQAIRWLNGDPSTPSYLLIDASYLPAIAAWARAEAMVARLTTWMEDLDVADLAVGQFPPAELLRRWESTAATARQRLGLDPTSRAKLQRDLVTSAAIEQTASIARHRAAGAEILETAKARGALSQATSA